MKRSIVLQSLGILFLFSQIAWGSVPQLINFQGVLKTPADTAVSDGSYSVTFTIYNAPTGGINLWTETQSVTTTGGLFAVLLGSTNPVPDSAFKGPDRYLGIAVSPDGEMLQRQQLVSVGYAYRVNSVDSASGGTISGNLSVSAGNFNLDNSSATEGNIFKGGVLFIHNFGTDNIFIGRNSGNLTMSGAHNTASGVNALGSNTTGSDNTASGAYALGGNTTGFSNTACGNFALLNNTTGHGNTASGDEALSLNTTGNNNTANGTRALASNTSGFSNTASGVNALGGNTTGSANTASGINALSLNTTGFNNTASGVAALSSNTTGNDNTASGLNVLFANTTGFENTANGSAALQLNTNGNRNTASGALALFSNTTGDSNTACGRSALFNNTTGSNNTAIGFLANVSAGNLNNATAIGANAIVGASNSLVLGGTGIYAVNVGIGTTSPSALLHVNSSSIAEVGRFQSNTAQPYLSLWYGTFEGARIQTVNDVSDGGSLRLFTAAPPFGSVYERMRITSAGNVGIGTMSPGASNLLELSSTTKGFVLPRMTKTERNAIASPVAGMMIYQTDNTPGLRVYNGTNWMRFTETAD